MTHFIADVASPPHVLHQSKVKWGWGVRHELDPYRDGNGHLYWDKFAAEDLKTIFYAKSL